MGRVEIVACATSETVELLAALVKCRKTRISPARTYPPLAHRVASVTGTRAVDKAWISPARLSRNLVTQIRIGRVHLISEPRQEVAQTARLALE